METLGAPPEKMIRNSTWKDVFFDKELKPLSIANDRGKIKVPGTKPINKIMERASIEF